MAIASLLAGVLSVLGPLHLAAVGWGATAIGGVWLISAGVEAVGSPLIGRLSDRRGAIRPVRAALGVGALVSVGLAFGGRPLVYAPLLLIASVAYGTLFTPAFALIADGADRVGLAQGLAFGLMNAAWAVGAVIGPAAGGAVAGATGDWVPFVLAAVLCAASLAATGGSIRRHPVAEDVTAVPGSR
jgi:MFS family permease